MKLLKTLDNETLLRLRDEESGGAVTVSKDGETGRILSVFVPEEGRRKGIGTSLLSAAESLLFADGFRELEADFFQKEEISAFYTKAGFEVKQSSSVIRISTADVLNSPVIKKAMSQEVEGTEFLALSNLFLVQWQELCTELDQRNLSLTESDMQRFDPDISGGVYDEAHDPRASVFCTEIEDGLLIELLLGDAKNQPKYVLAALKGMMNGIVETGGAERFPSLTMIAANIGVAGLLSRFFNGAKLPEPAGYTAHAMRRIEGGKDFDIAKSSKEEDPEVWKTEIEGLPYQKNIAVKLPLFRGKQEKPEPSDAGEKTAPIGYKKDLAPTTGLFFKGTIRITDENLTEFSEALPPDTVQNLPRPFYRGLASGERGSESEALLVWEYKNLEEDIDTEAEIVFFRGTDEENALNLLSEFESEIEKENTRKSFFELPKKEKALSSAGFSSEAVESQDLFITLDEIAQVSAFRKKPASYVKPLKSITDKQYRRAVASFLFQGRKGLLEDIAFLPRDWFDLEISSCTVMDEKAEGMLLVHDTASEMLFIDLLFSTGAEYQKDLLMMMRYSLRAAIQKFGGTKTLLVRRHNSEVRTLMDKLFPQKKGESAFYGERREI